MTNVPTTDEQLPELPEPAMRELNPYKGSVLDPHNGAVSLHWFNEKQLKAYAREAIAAVVAERDYWKLQVYDELDANLAFREAGGALSDEDMPTFCARLIAERDALLADKARLDYMDASAGAIRFDHSPLVPGYVYWGGNAAQKTMRDAIDAAIKVVGG